MTHETPRELAESAASVLAPETDLLADPDVAGFGRALAMVFRGTLDHPAEASQAWQRRSYRGHRQPARTEGLVPGGNDYPDSAGEWRSRAARHDGSWGEDWAAWSAENSGPLTDPPPTGSDRYPVLYAGPGEYVRT